MMATARELLEQADALMRKNRSRAEAADIPVLTDVIEAPLATASAPSRADVPVLTDAIEALEVDIPPLPPERRPPAALFEGDPSDWLVMDTIDPAIQSVTGRPPDTLGIVPAVTLKAAGSAATPPPEGSQHRPQQEATPAPEFAAQAGARQASSAESTAPEAAREAEIELEPQPVPEEIEQRSVFEPPIERMDDREQSSSHDAALQSAPIFRAPEQDVPAQQKKDDDERWATLSEQISMQLLQRIDLFTDTGLKEQLSAHLQPIVERAGAELVATINEHVGRLLRTYIAEAIEREIAQWRDGQR